LGAVQRIDLYPEHAPQPHLKGWHTVFGKVIEGHDVVDAIQKGDALEAVTVRG